VFALRFAALESLVPALNRFDFAVFVLTPDDLIVSRGTQQSSARDNVLIEFGLLVGRLGRERTFLVCCTDDKIKIPSDLAGITFARTRSLTTKGLTSAVGPACTRIRKVIVAATEKTYGQKI
jgi:predicted nucleotide-binding protein